MSGQCTAAARERCRRARRDLLALHDVEAVSMQAPSEDPQNSWTLDIVVWRDDGLVPPAVSEILGEYGLAHHAAPQGSTVQILAVD